MPWQRPPTWLQAAFPHRVWRAAPPAVYLTFDDGPHPAVTPRVLELLAEHNAMGTFFLRGDHAEQHPALVQEIAGRGHGIGNHGYAHPDGWRTPTEPYLQDVKRGQAVLQDILGVAPRLFRPPYGRLKPAQARELRKKHQLVMWTALPGDYTPRLSPQTVLRRCIRAVVPGAILCLHDSPRAWPTLQAVLPELLAYLAANNLSTAPLPCSVPSPNSFPALAKSSGC